MSPEGVGRGIFHWAGGSASRPGSEIDVKNQHQINTPKLGTLTIFPQTARVLAVLTRGRGPRHSVGTIICVHRYSVWWGSGAWRSAKKTSRANTIQKTQCVSTIFLRTHPWAPRGLPAPWSIPDASQMLPRCFPDVPRINVNSPNSSWL